MTVPKIHRSLFDRKFRSVRGNPGKLRGAKDCRMLLEAKVSFLNFDGYVRPNHFRTGTRWLD